MLKMVVNINVYCSFYDNFRRFFTLSRPVEANLAAVEKNFGSVFDSFRTQKPNFLELKTDSSPPNFAVISRIKLTI